MKRVLAVFVVLVICMSMFGMLSPKTMAQSPQPTSVTVSCSPNPAEADSPVTITAVVTGQNPTGSITWSSETTSISNQEGVEGSFTSNVSLVSANGISTTTFYDSIYGSDLITATYSGDSFNSPSVGTSTLTLVPEPMPQLSVVLSGTQSTSAIPTQPIGSTFSVDVRAENLTGIKPGVCAIGYELIWNPSVLSFTSYSDNNWLPDQMNLDIISSQWISIGTAIISQIAFDTNSAWACTTVNGSVSATFRFRVISGGSSSIDLREEGTTGYIDYPALTLTGVVTGINIAANTSNAIYGTSQALSNKSSAYVYCSANPDLAGSPVTCNAIIYGGNSVPAGTITWSTNSSTASFGSVQTSLINGMSKTSFVDANIGNDEITAIYSGDSNNSACSGNTTLSLFVESFSSIPRVSVVLSGTQNVSDIPPLPIGSSFNVDVRVDNLTGISPA